MSTDETYNGWTNRETWAVALWINNDEGWRESVHDALRDSMELGEYIDTGDGMSLSTAARYAADVIRENVETLITADGYRETFGEPIPESLVKIAEDIGSLYRVDWTELGAAFLQDLSDES